MRFLATLSPGATVIAADYFGPIVRGQLGIVTGCRRGTWLPWQRTAYVCTFLGGISVTATRWQILAHDHDYSRQMVEDPYWFLHTRTVPAVSSNVGSELRRPSR